MLQLVIEKPATLSRKHHHPPGNSLITHGVGKNYKKVSFIIHLRYAYILNGKKFIKNAKNCSFDKVHCISN